MRIILAIINLPFSYGWCGVTTILVDRRQLLRQNLCKRLFTVEQGQWLESSTATLTIRSNAVAASYKEGKNMVGRSRHAPL